MQSEWRSNTEPPLVQRWQKNKSRRYVRVTSRVDRMLLPRHVLVRGQKLLGPSIFLVQFDHSKAKLRYDERYEYLQQVRTPTPTPTPTPNELPYEYVPTRSLTYLRPRALHVASLRLQGYSHLFIRVSFAPTVYSRR